MFVRKDKAGNLIAVGSIDNSLLTQLQRGAKKDSAKAESKPSDAVEPTDKPTDEPADKPTDEPKPAAVGPKAKSSTSTPRP